MSRGGWVTIDYEDPAQVTALANAWDGLADKHATLGPVRMTMSALRMQAALREFANPRPDEPTGLGAVVEDADGVRWVRWQEGPRYWVARPNVNAARWDDLSAVRVLSHGVTP